MAQFDVHVNAGRSAKLFPYLVIVQSGLLRSWDRCIIVPLSPHAGFFRDPVMAPTITLHGQPFHFQAHEIANVPRSALGRLAGNVSADGDAIIRALDQVLSRGYPD